jgi:hypothetical protein
MVLKLDTWCSLLLGGDSVPLVLTLLGNSNGAWNLERPNVSLRVQPRSDEGRTRSTIGGKIGLDSAIAISGNGTRHALGRAGPEE